METKFKHGAVVKTTKKVTIDDPLVEGIFIRGRKNTTDSIIDSPIHFKYKLSIWNRPTRDSSTLPNTSLYRFCKSFRGIKL